MPLGGDLASANVYELARRLDMPEPAGWMTADLLT